MPAPRILIGCETSGMVRRAFAARGWDAWSCDLLPADDATNRHIIGDVRDHLEDGWDMLAVMHPPCTRLCNSGVRWLHRPPSGRTREEMWAELEEACALFAACWAAPVGHVVVENPVMHRHARAPARRSSPAPDRAAMVVRRSLPEGHGILSSRPAGAGRHQPADAAEGR